MYYQMRLWRHCTQMIPKFISLLDRKLTVKFYNTPWQASALGALITTLIAISRNVKCWPSHGKRLLLCTSTTWVQRISCVLIKKKTLVLMSAPTLNGMFTLTQSFVKQIGCLANWNELVLSWQAVRFDEHYTLRISGHNYATLVKSGLQTQTNLVRKLKVSKEELARGYLTIIMENLHTNKDWYVLTYTHAATRERFLTWCSSLRHFMASQIWTWIPLSPFPTMVGLDFVKILRSPLKFPSVNQTHSKHPTSTELLTYGTISVKFNILLPSVLSVRLKRTLEKYIKKLAWDSIWYRKAMYMIISAWLSMS